MINTASKFYFLGTSIGDTNNWIDFDEGDGELSVQIPIGSYTLTDLALAIKTAMDSVGDLTYTVTFNRTNRKITIAATGTFSILKSTGSHLATNPWSVLGFTQSGDLSAASSYVGAGVAGDAYEPQFYLQSFVSTDDFQEAVEAVINETASGQIEVVKFGNRKFTEFNIMMATDIAQTNGVIQNNAMGVADLRRFMQFLVTKAPIEFMPNKNVPATFQKLILETTPDSQNGTGYRLRELYDRSLPGYYETGLLRFRLVEV